MSAPDLLTVATEAAKRLDDPRKYLNRTIKKPPWLVRALIDLRPETRRLPMPALLAAATTTRVTSKKKTNGKGTEPTCRWCLADIIAKRDGEPPIVHTTDSQTAEALLGQPCQRHRDAGHHADQQRTYIAKHLRRRMTATPTDSLLPVSMRAGGDTRNPSPVGRSVRALTAAGKSNDPLMLALAKILDEHQAVHDQREHLASRVRTATSADRPTPTHTHGTAATLIAAFTGLPAATMRTIERCAVGGSSCTCKRPDFHSYFAKKW